jgi:tetratricopeptide (TPR) repeat protein
MDAQIDPQLSPTARRFLEETTMKSLFGISDSTLDAVMALAYRLHRAGRNPEAAILCRGLIAADHKYWWSYSLYAAALRQLGQLDQALVQLERGLAYEPDNPKLLAMHTQFCQPLTTNTVLRAAA